MSIYHNGTGALPLIDLIEQRRHELTLKKSQLVKRWGYANVAKGLRRLTQLTSGNYTLTEGQLLRLASALELPADDIRTSYAATLTLRRQVEDSALQHEHATWSKNFIPHAILVTERKIPNPIFVAAICGADNILRIDFDVVQHEDTWVQQVCAKLPDTVVAFGGVVGFVLNYSTTRASEYDRHGRFRKALARPLRPGRATLTFKGGRETASEQWQALGDISVLPVGKS